MTAFSRWRQLRTNTGGAAALRASRVALADERQKTVQTRVVSESLRDLRENNHFADLIVDSMRGPDAAPH